MKMVLNSEGFVDENTVGGERNDITHFTDKNGEKVVCRSEFLSSLNNLFQLRFI